MIMTAELLVKSLHYLRQSLLPTAGSVLDLAGGVSCGGGHTMNLPQPTLYMEVLRKTYYYTVKD